MASNRLSELVRQIAFYRAGGGDKPIGTEIGELFSGTGQALGTAAKGIELGRKIKEGRRERLTLGDLGLEDQYPESFSNLTLPEAKVAAETKRTLSERTKKLPIPLTKVKATRLHELITGGKIKEGDETTLGEINGAAALYRSETESGERERIRRSKERETRIQKEADRAQRARLARVSGLNTRLNSINTRLASKKLSSRERIRLEADRKGIEKELGFIVQENPGIVELLTGKVKEFFTGKAERKSLPVKLPVTTSLTGGTTAQMKGLGITIPQLRVRNSQGKIWIIPRDQLERIRREEDPGVVILP